ncbi:MAG: phosphoribosyl-AMP cyclohydrolase [Caldilineales bacterium]|nr:phosphoribosyl-AMP cyclohydrolase [Caldilineales bacterium]
MALAAAGSEETPEWLERVRFDDRGLVPAIVQDAASGAVLTLAYMNREALLLTLRSGQTHFWSRSRGELWHKGATSGHFQQVVELRLDCDGDAILARVHPYGPACHTGHFSCFFQILDPTEPPLAALAAWLGDGADAAGDQ